MEAVLNFLFVNEWGQIITSCFGASGLAAQIAALTKTKKDDAAIGLLGHAFNVLAGNYFNAKNR